MVREKCVLDFSSQMTLTPQITLEGNGVPQKVRKPSASNFLEK